VLHQWISAAFHAYVIYRMYAGVASVNLLRKLETAVAAQRSYYHARPDAPAAGNAQAGGPWYSGASTRVELDAPDAARPKSDSGSGQE
jgi:hypothetical protein